MDFASLLTIGVDSSDVAIADRALLGLEQSGRRTEKGVASSMHAVSGSMSKAADTIQQKSQRITRQSRQAINNLSYQLTDIAQMTAAGQSPFMLMMQQGEQTAGAMRDLSRTGGSALKGLSSAFTQILNPVSLATYGVILFGSMAIQKFMASREAAETLEDQMKSLNDTFKGFDAAASDVLTGLDEVTEKYGEAASKVRELNLAIFENQKASLENQVSSFMQDNADPFGLSDTLKGLQPGIVADFFGLERSFWAISDAAKEAREEVDGIVNAVISAANEMNSANSIDSQISALENMIEAYSRASEAAGGRSEAESEYIDALQETLLKLYGMQATEGRVTETTANRVNAATNAWQEYYQSRIAGQMLADRQEAELAEKAQSAWAQYYQSRIAGQMLLERQNAELAEKAQSAWAQYYQSRVAGQMLAARQEAELAEKAQSAWTQYYQSRVAGQMLLERQNAELAERAISAWTQYYQSRVAGEQATAAINRASADALGEENELASRRLEILQSYNEKGEATLRTAQLQLQLDADILREKLLQEAAANGLTEAEAKAVEEAVQLFRATANAELAIDNAASSANVLSGNIAVAANNAIALRNAMSLASVALGDLNGEIQDQITQINIQTQAIKTGVDSRILSYKAERDAIVQTMAESGASLDQIAAFSAETTTKIEALSEAVSENEKAEKAAADARKAASAATKGAGKAAKQAEKELKAMNDEILRLEEAADPTKKFRREMEQLDKLLENGLSDGAYEKAVRDLNEELLNSTPILSDVNDAFGQMVDYMFDGFKDGMKGILDIFVNTLKQMAATALKNRITIGLGLGVSGAGGAAAGQGGGILSNLFGGGGGMFGNLLGSWGGGAGLLGGAGTTVGAFLNGGIGAGFGAIGSNIGAAFAAPSLGSISTAIGSALPVVGVALAAASFFKKTKEVIGNGVALQMDGAMAELLSFEKSKEVSGWGMISSGFDRDYDRMDDTIQNVLSQRIDNTLNALEQFGLNTNLSGFSYRHMTPTLKDGEDPTQAIEDSIQYVLSEAINYLTGDAIHQVKQAGENLASALDRLVSSFNAVNEGLYLLGQNTLPISLASADAASKLLELTGGLDQFNTKIGNVFSTMLTDAEQQARLTEIAMTEMTAVFEGLNMVIPETHAEFMALLDAQDLTTEAGRQTYAALLDVSGAFVQVNGTAQQAADAAAAAAQGIGQAAGAVTQLGQAAQALTRRDVIDPGVAVLQARADDADSAVRAAEDALRAAFAAQQDQISADAQAEINAVNAAMERAQNMADLANQRIQEEADAAVQMARDGAAAMIETIRAATSAQIDRLNTEVDTAQQRVSLYRSMSSALENAFNNRRVLDALGMRNQGAWATQFLRSALLGGGTEDLAGLERALDIVADPATALYDSFADYQQDFNVNTNLIEGLRDLTNGQLTIEERSLAALESQIDNVRQAADDQIASLEAQTDREIAAIEAAAQQQIEVNTSVYEAQIEAIERAREDQLAASEGQMNALLGIDTSVMSVEAAIENLNAALAAQEAAQAALNVQEQDPTQFTAGSFASQLDTIFREELGRGVRQSGLEYYGQEYIGGATLEDIRRAIANSAEAQMFDATGVPMFASGGQHKGGWRIVGERGIEMEYTGPSRIYSNQETQRMFDNAELVAEVRALRQNNEEMAAEIRQIRRFAQSRTDIVEEQRAEELQAATEAVA